MKTFPLIILLAIIALPLQAQIDMQAHAGSDAGKNAYSSANKQSAYYTGSYSYSNLIEKDGNELFGMLNTLMGNTSRIDGNGYSYNSLRDAYINVDVDLNAKGTRIIGFYDGRSMNGQWDGGSTWNREHTWPQSKGANKSTPMGHDMQSVRPTWSKSNSERGNTAYGESNNYYDPDDMTIENSYYLKSNIGSYRGDAARVILYDYLVYGEAGGYKNSLYSGNAQLLQKLGTPGVFESVEVLIKWHLADPPSLTETVRNDGAQNYQGNRNPFIDYPELALKMMKQHVSTYDVECNMAESLWPAHSLTVRNGFTAYVTASNGSHPDKVAVTNASYTYDASTGRLIVKNVTGKVTISTSTPTTGFDTMNETTTTIEKIYYNGNIYIVRDGVWYDLTGNRVK